MPTITEALALYRKAGKTRLEKLTLKEKQVFNRVVLPVRGAYISQGVTPTHTAIDFAAPLGTPVVAPVRGVVTSVQDLKTGYGRHVRIRTPAGLELIFGHLGDVFVKAGQSITAGLQLGTIGMTGSTTGPHLHFETRIAGRNVIDPWPFFEGAIQPVTAGMQTGVKQPARISVDVPRATRRLPIVTSTPTVRSLPPSVNFGDLSTVTPTGIAGTAVAITKGETTSNVTDLVGVLTKPFERAAVGAVGMILIVVGLFILSSGLREKAVDVGIFAGKALAGAAVGGPAGATVAAVA